jgi:hypothetical protein
MTTAPMAAPMVRFLASVHSSRCGRGGAFGLTLGSDSLAVGSSTRMGCGFVQRVTMSLLARWIAIGTGGSVMSLRPGSLGRGTKGIERRVTAPVSVSSRVIVGGEPPF